jgi:hypothetical protein
MSGTAFSSTQLLTQFLQDEAFLLRCASTFDWNNLTRRCTLIIEIFTTSILDRHESNHLQIKRSAVRQLTQTDNWNNTPLHMACFNRAQDFIIGALLEASAAANVNLVEFQKRNCLDTPLLIACGMGASPRVIQLLVSSYISGGEECGNAIRMADSTGKTPLVELCQYYEKSRLNRQRQNRRYRNQNSTISPTLQEANLFDAGSYSNLFQQFWESSNYLLRSNWMHTRPGGEASFVSILHAAATIAESCPADFIDLILRTNAHMVSFPSRRGVLPLHLAVSTTDSNKESYELQQQHRSYVVAKLCEMYPLAVSQVCPFSGRTPFCQAIASGLAWNDGSSSDIGVDSCSFFPPDNDDDSNTPHDVTGPLQTLLQHQPDALYARDLVSHLPPFLLAASITHTDDRLETDTIYGLLRAHPQVLSHMLLA